MAESLAQRALFLALALMFAGGASVASAQAARLPPPYATAGLSRADAAERPPT